jgi:hypothetical protein
MAMRGRILDIRPILHGETLKIAAKIETRDWGVVDAFLPDREVSAFLPRSVLLGDARRAAPREPGAQSELGAPTELRAPGQLKAPRVLLETIGTIIKRMAGGREVRLWKYGDLTYFAFLSWRGVKFTPRNIRGRNPRGKPGVPPGKKTTST